jgi:hypothetical protein
MATAGPTGVCAAVTAGTAPCTCCLVVRCTSGRTSEGDLWNQARLWPQSATRLVDDGLKDCSSGVNGGVRSEHRGWNAHRRLRAIVSSLRMAASTLGSALLGHSGNPKQSSSGLWTLVAYLLQRRSSTMKCNGRRDVSRPIPARWTLPTAADANGTISMLRTERYRPC